MSRSKKKRHTKNSIIYLRQRTPAQWSEMLKAVKDTDTRTQVACIVWWDYFGGNPATENSCPELREYVDRWTMAVNPSPESLLKAMIQIGYPEAEAKKRIKWGRP